MADTVRPESEAEAPAAEQQQLQQRRGLLLLVSCVIIWGVSAVAFKVCTRPPTGPGLDPILLTGLRFAVVAPCMALIVGLRQPELLRLPKGDWLRYVVFGFFAIVLAETLMPMALRYTSAANLTLLSHGTLSLFTALWALALFRQRIAASGWVGAGVALLGVAIVALSGGRLATGGDAWKGDALALFRSLEHSCYLLVMSRFLMTRPVAQVTLYNCVFGALWMLPYVLWKGASFPWAEVTLPVWGWFAWTVVPTTLYGFLAWNSAMRHVGAVAASNLFYLMPVSAAVAAWLILGEPIRAGHILGGAIILSGVLLLRWDALVAAGLVRVPDIRLPWRRM
jgi:Permeases of the drug/metabolite transporter (DMT) superfamily